MAANKLISDVIFSAHNITSKNKKYTLWSIKKRDTFIFSITLANIVRFS